MSNTLIIAQPTRSESRLGQFKSVDPHDWSDVKEIISINEAIYDGLIRRGPNLELQPGLASSWETDSDRLSWFFHLRDDVTFHNGEPFNSVAAKFSMERMAKPALGFTYAEATIFTQYLDGLIIEVLDDFTIKVTTPSPNSELPQILVEGYMVPPIAIQELGEAFKYQPIGTGPYRIAELKENEHVLAKSNPTYFGSPPSYGEVSWRLIPDEGERLAALDTADAVIAVGASPKNAQLLEGRSDVQVVRTRDTCAYAYFFNCSRGPLRDPRVRQAVNLAVDKEAIVRSLLDGAGYVMSGIVGPAHAGFNPRIEPYPYDPARARNLLAAAGFAKGMTITIDTPLSLPAEALRLSQMVAEQLREVGIQASLNITEDRLAYANKVRQKKIADMCCFDSTPLSIYRVLKEKISSRFRGAWWQGYHNSEVEQLIEEAENEFEPEAREALYRRCYKIVHDDPPWLFLYNAQNLICVTDRLRDWRPRADGSVIPQWIDH